VSATQAFSERRDKMLMGRLLDKFKFFTVFYHLSEQRSRDKVMRIVIECFDYTL
jgi:hypothetical protein